MSDTGCPFCALIAGTPGEAPRSSDVVAARGEAVAIVSPRWWPRNPGHVLVIAREHVEDLYSAPRSTLHGVVDLAQDAAVAIKEVYACDGVSLRQHNEAAGGQDVFHLHLHVFPRYRDDDLYGSQPLDGFVDPAERALYADRLRAHPRLREPYRV